MQFGINLITSNYVGDRPTKVLQEYLDTAIAAEELGYRSIWTTEHHFASDRNYRPFGASEQEYRPRDYDMSSDPMTLLSWAAAKTKTLRVGTAVSILHWDHPIRTVERAALLDTLSGGRLEFGVGRGLGFREATVFGVPGDPQANERRYHEAIQIIRTAWKGEPFSFDGEFYTVPELAITPQPQREIPLIVGSASNNSAVWAAQNDLPYATITWPLVDVDVYKEKRKAYLAAGEQTGNDVGRHLCPHFLYMYCGETDEQAAEICEHYMTQFQYIIEQHYELARPHAENDNVTTDQDKAFSGKAEDQHAQMRKLALAPVEQHIVGSVETCIERVRMYENEVGANYIVLNMAYANMPMNLHMASMRRFAKHVISEEPLRSPKPELRLSDRSRGRRVGK
jgi:alkanesulfonate monooxygenase SsuD/methylene tetrahydromethanopterin reductase-like flavin-dependent oxidoreductase (luciferase family)